MSTERVPEVITEEPGGSELVPYERGLPFKDAATGALGRFLPGAAISLVAGLGLLQGELLFSLDGLVVVAGALTTLTAGYAGGLELLRRHLFPDARLAGRRSFIAGLVAPLAVWSAGVLGPLPTGDVLALALLFVPAAIIAVLMFFAWLTPTPPELRGPGFEDVPE